MGKTIKEEAQQYEPPTTKNITELEKVSVDLVIEEREYTKQDGTTFKLDVIVVDGEDYRMPISVLKNLKAILVEKPNLKFFKVSKSGESFKTVYTVITLD